MKTQDVRWKQRFNSYERALGKLTEAVEELSMAQMSEIEKEGLIQRFEYTFELAWKTLQDLIKHKGIQDVQGPKAVLTEALKMGLIHDRNLWQEITDARNLTSHTYNEGTADQVAKQIFVRFYAAFAELHETLTREASQSDEQAIR